MCIIIFEVGGGGGEGGSTAVTKGKINISESCHA